MAKEAVAAEVEEKDVEKKEELTEEEQQEKAALQAEMDELDMAHSSGSDHEPNAIDKLLAEEEKAAAEPEEPSAEPTETQERTAVKEGEGGPVTDPAKEAADSKAASPATPVASVEELMKRLDAIDAKNAQLHKENVRLNRKLVEAHERMKSTPPVSGDTDQNTDNSYIDPDVRKTIRGEVIALTSEQQTALYKESEEDLLDEGIEREEYDDTVKRFFLPAQSVDPKLTRRWNRSNDPARFAYEEGKKIKDRLTAPKEDVVPKSEVERLKAEYEAKVEAAREEGRQEVKKGVFSEARKVAGLPPSLSQAGRTPAPASNGKLTSRGVPQKELDEL